MAVTLLGAVLVPSHGFGAVAGFNVIAHYEERGVFPDMALGLDIAPDGSVWVAGSMRGDPVLWKFDSSLVLQSSAALSHDRHTEYARAVRIVADGTVFVVGGVRRPNKKDYAFIAKFSPDFVLIASRTVRGRGPNLSEFRGIAEGPIGHLLAVGTMHMGVRRRSGAWIVEFNQELEMEDSAVMVDVRRPLGWFDGAAVSRNGDIWLAGMQHNDNEDAWVARFSKKLVFLSSAARDGGNQDFGEDIAIAPDGTVWVAANHFGKPLRPIQGFIERYDAGMNLLKRMPFAASGKDEAALSAIAFDRDGNAWISGRRNGMLWLLKFDPEMNLLKEHVFSAPAMQLMGASIRAAPDGAIFIAGGGKAAGNKRIAAVLKIQEHLEWRGIEDAPIFP